MGKNNSNSQTLQVKTGKKSFYVTEILMLKSIIVLLILTFFLLSEMQAANHEIKALKNAILYKQIEQPSTAITFNR